MSSAFLSAAIHRLPSASRMTLFCRRGSSGHGHSHSNGHGNPVTESEAYLFGEKPHPAGHRRVREDWEVPFNTMIWGGFLFCGIGLALKPETSAKAIAREEAIKRASQ